MTDETIKIGHNLNLASNIAINYVVPEELLTDYDSCYMECAVPVYEGNTLTGMKSLTLEPELRNGYYYFVLDGLISLEMNNVVEARLHMTKGNRSYVSPVDTYSIATYAYSQMNNPKMLESLKRVCANLLQYGARAQLWKGYRTDALADSAMTQEHRAWLTDVESVTFEDHKKFCGDMADATVFFVGVPLSLDSRIVVRYVINTTQYAGRLEDLNLHITYIGTDGEEKRVILTELEVFHEPNDYYVFDYDGLLAAELRTVMSVRVYEGETPVSETLEYSVDTYGNGKTGDILTLIRAMIAYSDSAKDFFA